MIDVELREGPAVAALQQLDHQLMLPPRLREVGTLLAGGASDKEIAARLDLPLQTARTYAARVLRKLGLRSRRGLMR